MLKILVASNKILTAPNQPVVNFDKKLEKLCKEMDKTLIAQKDPQGVGLAAPQIGENLRLFIIKPAPEVKTEVFINPRIIRSLLSLHSSIQSAQTIYSTPDVLRSAAKTPLEGCLSIPRIWGAIKRAKKILIEYQTVSGEKVSKWYSGFKAIIIQHEIDHLNGVLFTQRALEQQSQLFEEKNGKLEKIIESG